MFCEGIKALETDGKPIVYIDESGFAKDMPRTHGYAPKGQRCFGPHDWRAKGRTNVVGALMGAAMLTVSLFDANINADIFHGWITQDLIPKLPPHATLVMDNAAFHKRDDIKQAIKDA